MARKQCKIQFEKDVTCQICGLTHPTTIQNHIRFKHPEINCKEYKEKYDAEITSNILKAKRAKGASIKRGPMSDEQKRMRSEKNKSFWSGNDEMKERVAERMRESATNGEHPSQTEEFREVARQNAIKRNKSNKQREAVSKALTGRALPAEQIEKSAAGHRGIPLSEEHKAKISEIHREAFASGERVPTHAKVRGYYTKKTGERLPYMSDLERVYFEILDKENKEWKYENIKIPYMLDGVKRTYFPDVLIESDNELIEVKAKYFWYTHKEKCEAKAEAARKYCKENGLTYKILYEDDLGIEYSVPDYIRKYNFPRG